MFRVEVADRARDDADEAFAYLEGAVSPGFAATWYQGLFEQVEALARLPARCPVAVESRQFADEIRELIYGKRRHEHRYRTLFSIRDDLVSVLAIQHTARREFEP